MSSVAMRSLHKLGRAAQLASILLALGLHWLYQATGVLTDPELGLYSPCTAHDHMETTDAFRAKFEENYYNLLIKKGIDPATARTRAKAKAAALPARIETPVAAPAPTAPPTPVAAPPAPPAPAPAPPKPMISLLSPRTIPCRAHVHRCRCDNPSHKCLSRVHKCICGTVLGKCLKHPNRKK